MDRDKIIKQLCYMRRIETRKFAFKMFFLGTDYTFIKTQGEGFPFTCNRVVYQVIMGLDEVVMYVVLEKFMNDIRINYYSETEISNEMYEVCRAFRRKYVSKVYFAWMKQ
ncbi:hypothetical protein LCGC14_2360220 [marine sediment metagenome]|uniref:Uncharacterized protein n=1 Tax=marine sediment metagenome TaxID=412755 RepID=A0A0F9F1P0_9ZZZZ